MNYDREIVIEKAEKVSDGMGGFNITWAKYKAIQARRRQLRGSEIFNNDKKGYYANYRYYFDFIDISEVDRINDNGEIHEIRNINNPHELNRFLQVDTEII